MGDSILTVVNKSIMLICGEPDRSEQKSALDV